MPQFKNHIPYIKMWLLYVCAYLLLGPLTHLQADSAKDPSDIYKFMNHNDIGTLCPLFYAAWAFSCQTNRAFKQAKEILQLGVKR